MAESKKKSIAKKKAAPKKSSSAKATPKKSATKKAPVAAAPKKSAKTTKAQPKETKKVETKEATKKHVSSDVKESSSNTWMVAAIILIVIVLGLVGVIGYYSLSGNDDTNVEPVVNGETPVVTGGVELLIVEDPTCVNCQVDLFADQVKANLIPDLSVSKVSFESEEGQKIITELDVNQVPVYLFSTNIDQRDDWETQLAGAFVAVEISGESYYLLNPQFIPNKVMIEDVKITETALTIGDENAPVTIIKFTDFECPFCAIADGNPDLVTQFAAQNPGYEAPMPNVIENYVDKGLVKVVFYNFPIASLHPNARIVHNAALCANEQDGFEAYERKVWDSRSEWTSATVDRVETLKGYAVEQGLNAEQFNACLDAKKYDSQIDEELALGQAYGVSGTPAFFIGKTFISGAQEYSVFKELIDAELAKAQN